MNKLSRNDRGQTMATKTMTDEKRKHSRYVVDLGAYAIFRKDNSVLPGLIVDISLGGVAFFFHEDEQWPQDEEEKFYLFGDECNVEDITLKAMYDSEVRDQHHTIYQLVAAQKATAGKIIRRGAQFGPMTDEQKKRLTALVKEFEETRNRTSDSG